MQLPVRVVRSWSHRRRALQMRFGGVAGLLALAVQSGPAAQEHARPQDTRRSEWTPGANMAGPPDLPVIGKWMITASGIPAHWMGQSYRGKHLREPINVIIVDEVSASASQASTAALAAAAAAGYPVRWGHSTGYKAVVGDQVYAQLPRGWDDALSDAPFEFSNNHGRLFGPHATSRGYVLIGAFSREEVDPFRWPGHLYASFNKARDDFAERLDRLSPYRRTGFVDLQNAISDDPLVSTGDHDGKAILLKAAK